MYDNTDKTMIINPLTRLHKAELAGYADSAETCRMSVAHTNISYAI